MTHSASELKSIADILGPDSSVLASGVRVGVTDISGERQDQSQLTAAKTTNMIVFRTLDALVLDDTCYVVVSGTTYIVDYLKHCTLPRIGMWLEAYCHVENGGQAIANTGVTPAQTFKQYVDAQDEATLDAAEAYADAHGGAAALTTAEAYTDAAITAEAAARTAADTATLSSAHTYTDTQVGSEASARATADALKEDRANKGVPNGYAPLDSNGLIPNSAIPPLAISKPNVVASQAAMLALTAEEGDIAIRTDINANFVLGPGGNPANLGDWLQLLTPAAPVQSVAGKTGTIVLVEGDITNLTADLAGKQAALGYTPENAANKDVANGYAGLDAGGKLKTSEAPTWNQSTTGTAAGLSGTPVLPNGTTATTQTAGDNSTEVATTAYVDTTSDIDLASGVGIFLPFGEMIVQGDVTTVLESSANVQYGIKFRSPFTITIGHVTCFVGVGLAGAKMGVALLDSTGATKLSAADGFAVDTTHLNAQRNALSATITLRKGLAYWLVWTITSVATPTITNLLLTTQMQAIMDANGVKVGQSGSATSGGNTTATLGSMSNGGVIRVPILYFD